MSWSEAPLEPSLSLRDRLAMSERSEKEKLYIDDRFNTTVLYFTINILYKRTDLRNQIVTLTVLTVTEVSKDVVALLRESDLIDSMPNETSFQEVTGIFTSLSAVLKSLYVMVEPLHHI